MAGRHFFTVQNWYPTGSIDKKKKEGYNIFRNSEYNV